MTIDILDRDHQSPAEPVVMSPLSLSRPRNGKTGLFDKLRRNHLFVQEIEEVSPSLRGKAESKRADGLRSDPSVPKILPGSLSRRRLERPRKIVRGKSVDPADLFPEGTAFAFLAAQRPVRNDDPDLSRQLADRLRKGQMVEFHQEGKGISALTATVTVKYLFIGAHVKGGCFLLVKGTEPEIISPRLPQGHILPDKRNDIGSSAGSPSL